MATRTRLTTQECVVTGGHTLEVEAGLRVLQQGGNAVDAVVAAAFTGFVVEPAACGVGGYGRLAVFLAERGEFVTVDHYVRAPAAAHPRLFALDPDAPPRYYGHPRTQGRLNERGHLAVAVPGAVAGLCETQALLGRLSLAQVLDPAIEAADRGVLVTWPLALAILEHYDDIRQMPHTAAWLLPNGRPPRAQSETYPGDRLDGAALARTLRRIAADGAAGFYDGPVAEAIEREVCSGGGLLTTSDLRAYRPKVLRERPGRYRGRDYVTANDQVGYEALNILEHFDLTALDPDGLAFRHLMAEALGLAFTDNLAHYGDPDHTRCPVAGLASPGFAATRAAAIDPRRALPRPMAPGDPWPFESESAPERDSSTPSLAGIEGTSQMAAIDRDGNLAVVCTSVTGAFGSLVTVPDTGIILNNGMQNFDPRPDRPNSLAPGKMPIFAVPTLAMLEQGRARLGVCGSGGYRITTAVLHTLVHHLDFGLDLQAAVDAPRVHCQGDETFVDAAIPAHVRASLAALGHSVVVQANDVGIQHFGRVNAVAVDPATGLRHAATGPAWNTAAGGW
jgi:gamma-glutamyltranspeptidase/glutathione hydrolase